MAQLRLAVASVSLGRSAAGHGLLQKIKQASLHSFQGIEIFYECLEHHANSLQGDDAQARLKAAAYDVRTACEKYGITVICLQPFAFAEGLIDLAARAEMLGRLRFWFKLAKILQTDLIQVPTNFLRGGTTGNLQVVSADLREMARMGMEETPPIRLAYEAVSWGSHIDVWEKAWDVAKMVDMPNFGLCLDTFHIAGRTWGDPTTQTGRAADADLALAASLERMARELDVSKIFYVQSGDAQKLDPPLTESHPWYDPAQRPRMTWSRNGRLFAYEEDRGGYLPAHLVLETIINKLGYRGWVSLETFSRELLQQDRAIPEKYAKRGLKSWQTMLESLKPPRSQALL